MQVYIGGEDELTRAIAKRLVEDISRDIYAEPVNCEDITSRDRGASSLKKLPLIVSLGEKSPTIFVFDSDGDCVVKKLGQYCPLGWKTNFTAINVAVDEGENWLLADRKNFSRFFGINLSEVPVRNEGKEISLPYKTSTFIMHELVPKSRKAKVRENLSCTENLKKPPTYNALWLNYIYNQWNIEEAKQNSASLFRTIERIKNVLEKYLNSEGRGSL